MLLDDTQIELTGRWAYHINPLIPNQFHSFHATNHTGDFASLNFTGIGIEVYGILGPAMGNYSVRLDGIESTHSGLAATPQQGLLFSQQDLDGSKSHQIVITNQLEGHLLTVDLLNITQSSASSSSPSSSSGISRGSIIAIALVAAFCVFILVGSLAYLILRRRRRAVAIERRRLAEESFRPRMRSLVLPSEQSAVGEDRYPWMRPLSVANAPGAAQENNAPYDPYVQRRPPVVGRPTKLAPPIGESDDEVVDIVPRTRDELDALRPRMSNELPPSSFTTPVSPSFARSRRERQLDSGGGVGSEPSVYDP